MAEMKNKGILQAIAYILIAVVCAFVVTFGVTFIVKSYESKIAAAQKPIETMEVVVARRSLSQGVAITEQDIALVAVPRDFLNENLFTAIENVLGKYPREGILVNEFVRKERLADVELGQGLNVLVPRGMRAISINLADGSAVSGFVNPGNTVDILVSMAGTNEDGNLETHTVLQSVGVLAVNDRLQGASGEEGPDNEAKKPSVTLAATPEQAEKLAHAANLGEIHLALRNDLDEEAIATTGMDSSKLVGKKKKKPVVRQPRAKTSTGRQIVIISGGNRRSSTLK
jgi:pilus assembly protein CpaB